MALKTFTKIVEINRNKQTLKIDILFSTKTLDFIANVPEELRVTTTIEPTYKNKSLKKLEEKLNIVCEIYETFFKPQQIMVEEKLFISYKTDKTNTYLKEYRTNISYVYFKATKEYDANNEENCTYYIDTIKYPNLFNDSFLNIQTQKYEMNKIVDYICVDYTEEREAFLNMFSTSLKDFNTILNDKMVDLIDNGVVSQLPSHSQFLKLSYN